MGDFNIDLNMDAVDGMTVDMRNRLLDTLLLAGFSQLVNKSTRFCSNSIPSLLDHSWINNMTKHVQTTLIETDSDHDAILRIIKTNRNVLSNE